VPDALPKAALGHRVVTLSSWMHYALGVTIEQVRQIFAYESRSLQIGEVLRIVAAWIATTCLTCCHSDYMSFSIAMKLRLGLWVLRTDSR